MFDLIRWWMMKFVPGGHATFVAFVNTFVHIFMYSYYLLAALGPKYLKLQKFLEWKKYLTVNFCFNVFWGRWIHNCQFYFYLAPSNPSIHFGYTPCWSTVLQEVRFSNVGGLFSSVPLCRVFDAFRRLLYEDLQ